MAKSNGLNFNLPSVDDLFSTEEERAEARLEKVVNLSPTEISDFPNHPFKVRMDAAMQEMTESVKQYGVLVPALVRPKPEGGYEMVAGHRRKKAADLAGLAKIPCIVRQLTDDEATIIMVDSNLQREQILPSEKAFAYKMKLDALKRQGQRTDLTSSPLDNKLKGVTAAQQISRDSGDSQPQIYRYIRLTHLIPEILELVDNSVLKDQEMLQIAMRPAVELSYLRKEEQADLFAIMDEMDCTPSHAQAIKMRQMSEAKTGGERLAKDALVSIMKEEGITFVTNTNVGKDVKAAKLLKEYDRVVLACGAKNPRDIKAEGRDAKGIYFAVDFLTSVTKSLLDSKFEDHAYIDAKGKHVVVIGGGDTGNDCVGTSIRLGAKSVTQLEMMPKAPDQRAENNPWPEWPKICKTDYGQEEAIAVFGHDPRIYQTTVTEFIKNKKGEVCQIKTVKLTPKKDEKSDRMMMVPVEGTEEILPADLVLIAAGFLGSQKYVTDAFKVEVNQRTNVKTDDGKYQTTKENVFTAGDMHRGQSLVVWAIREGREAAKAVDESLMGYTNL